MADFSYPVSSIDEAATFSVDKMQFGDGYAQRVPNGINNGLRKWTISFTDRSLADADAMVEFWRSRYGATSFSWRPQGFAADVRVICSTYSRPIQNRYLDGDFVYNINATFEEVPL
jgi:phage-related protein